MLDTFRTASDDALAAIQEEQRVRGTRELFLLFALGSQFDHLIRQALERLGVYCLVADPATVTAADVRRLSPTGIILSGGPASVHAEPPPFDAAIFDLGTPVLGICLGYQMWAKHLGVPVRPGTHREFGVHQARILDPACALFHGLTDPLTVLESHGDRIEASPLLHLLATTEHAPAAAGHRTHLWGVQFHPEVSDTTCGATLFENFCFGICGAKDRFPAQDVAARKVRELRERIGESRVLLALSGGSDSSVVAGLLGAALAGRATPQVRAVYIRGIDRPDDEAHVLQHFGTQPWMQLRVVDATEQFLLALRGATSMRDKRVAMRGVYRDVLEEQAADSGARFIAQGTLYTDNSESGVGYDSGARRAVIKLHHNAGLKFSREELTPLDDCVKDGARNIGRALGVPESLLVRHPFPGPGLIIRIEGEVTVPTLATARAVDGIYIEELRAAGLYHDVWQAGAVITHSVTTCTKGDDATSGAVVALWAVTSVNGFTARFARLPWDFLDRVSRRITNELREVGAVVYRVSDKPPATIEWG